MTEKTIYEQVKYSYDAFCRISDKLESYGYYVSEPYEKDYGKIDRIMVSMEFEEFKRQYPDTYKKVLADFLKEYIQLQSQCEQYITSQEKFRNKLDVIKYVKDIDYLVDYLQGMVKPDDEVAETYLKSDKLLPIEKLLILHYLAVDSLRTCIFSSKAGKFFLSSLLDINPESIKKPLSKLVDYTANNELTPKQASSLYPLLERVKAFFDESELSKISAVIETRLTELQMKSGKV